jgi:hypothetical protein
MEAQYQINRGNPNTGIDLSEQNSLSCTGCDPSEWTGKDCTGSGGCGGNYLSDALNFLKNSGTPDEACNPYTATDPAHGATCGTNRCSDYLARTYKITDWTWISTDTATIKWFLYNHGPVMVWMPLFCTDPSCQTYDLPWWDASYWQSHYYGHFPSGDYEGHFVVIVGWNDDGGGYWTVRNSWGTSGGDVNDYGGGSHGGYFYMTMDRTNGFFGVKQEAAVSNVLPPPTVVTVKSKNIFDKEFSGVRVKVEWRESGHRRTRTLATPFSLEMQGLRKFTAPSTVRVGGVQYRFAHWEDETGATLSGSRSLSYNVQSGKTFYAVYGPKQYKLTVYVKDISTRKPVVGATVEVTGTYPDQHFTLTTNSRGKVIFNGIYGGQMLTITITKDGYQPFTTTIFITRNTTYRAYLTPL